MKAAIIGCGYVADFYLGTASNHCELEIAGAFDRDPCRLTTFAGRHGLRSYLSLDELLADGQIGMILNLTSPESHYEVSRRGFLAGKHVYSEKPMTLRLEDARALVELAAERDLTLGCAPSNMLGGAGRTLAGLLDDGAIGRPRLVYASLEAGPVHLENYADWRSTSGAPWPAANEFALGCTLEHAGYYLTWLCRLFGPVRQGTVWASLQAPDKGTGQRPDQLAPDISVACLQFDGGVVARLTCGMVAPKDLSLQVIGDGGTIIVEDAWNYRSPIRITNNRGEPVRDVPVVDEAVLGPSPSQMDFCRGPAEQARRIAAGHDPSADAAMLLHVTELTLLLGAPGHRSFVPTTRFDPTGIGAPRGGKAMGVGTY